MWETCQELISAGTLWTCTPSPNGRPLMTPQMFAPNEHVVTGAAEGAEQAVLGHERERGRPCSRAARHSSEAFLVRFAVGEYP